MEMSQLQITMANYVGGEESIQITIPLPLMGIANTIERNIATYYGGGIYTQRSLLTLSGNNTFFTNLAGEEGGIYATANSTLNFIRTNIFAGNRARVSGGGIWLDNSNLTWNGSNHFLKCIARYEGGAIFTYAATASLHGNNAFESNSATTGGGIHACWSNVSVTNISNKTLQCLVVQFSLTIAPLNSMVPALSKVIRLTTLVVVYMLQGVF